MLLAMMSMVTFPLMVLAARQTVLATRGLAQKVAPAPAGTSELSLKTAR